MICKHVCNIIEIACVCKIRGVGILYALYIGIPNTILLRYPNITIRLTQNISQNYSISENSGSSLYNKIHIETEIENYTIYTGTIIYTYHHGYSNSYLHYSHLTIPPSRVSYVILLSSSLPFSHENDIQFTMG